MLKRSRAWLHAPDAAVPRFFTGALFPEATAALLRQQQGRGTDSSSAAHIWVPRKLVVSGAFGPSVGLGRDPVVVNPTASIPAEATEFIKHLGPESLLVSASHTTDPNYFVQYMAYLDGVDCTAANQRTALSAALFPYIPQSTTGGLFQPRTAAKLAEAAVHGKFVSPYWIPEDWCRRRQPTFRLRTTTEAPVRIGGGAWLNVEQTMSPGTFHARFAAAQCYEPHTVYGGQFPRALEADMRAQAVARGFTMRLWVTVEEADAFGCTLRDGERSTIMTAALSRTVLDVYFNASQFSHCERLPTRRELLVLGANVNGLQGKFVHGFAKLMHTAPRSSEADRKFLARHQNYVPFVKSDYETQRLGVVAQQPLRQHAMLCGFTEPYFMVCHELNRTPQLVLRKGARGRCIHGGMGAVKHCVYFNSEDFECPNVVRALLARPSLHLTTYRRFFGEVQVLMSEYLARNTRSDARFWVPTDFLAEHNLEVPHLASTFHVTHGSDLSYLAGNSSNMVTNARPWTRPRTPAPPLHAEAGVGGGGGGGGRQFVHVSDVADPDGRLALLCAYMPVRADGSAFLDMSRQRILSAALKHDLLQSDPRWLTVEFCRAACGSTFSTADGACPSVEDDTAASASERNDDTDDPSPYEDPLGPATAPGTVANNVSTQNGRSVLVPFCGLTLREQTAVTQYLSHRKAVKQTLWNKMHVNRFDRAPLAPNAASKRDAVLTATFQEASALPCDANVF